MFCFCLIFKFFFSFSLLFFIFSLHTEIAYRGGVTRRGTPPAKYVSRFEFTLFKRNWFWVPFFFFFSPGVWWVEGLSIVSGVCASYKNELLGCMFMYFCSCNSKELGLFSSSFHRPFVVFIFWGVSNLSFAYFPSFLSIFLSLFTFFILLGHETLNWFWHDT